MVKFKHKFTDFPFILQNISAILCICENLFTFRKLFKKGESATEQLVDIERMENAVALFGSFDENILIDILKNQGFVLEDQIKFDDKDTGIIYMIK